ncbi:hypothetical protein C8R47DRAFT_1068942 [Mycena vitilis]|nr:hypothetical protein C8R47DRAFT_1068942 [Mycena vitilis]
MPQDSAFACEETPTSAVVQTRKSSTWKPAPWGGSSGSARKLAVVQPPGPAYTEAQNAQTLRFIRAHPEAEWSIKPGPWSYLPFRVSRYRFGIGKEESDGTFVMILDGPARGQIHGWSSET